MNKKSIVLFAFAFLALSLFVKADMVELNGTANVTVNQTNFGVNPPTNLQIHYNASDLNDWLNWTDASGADGYYVYYSNDLQYILSLDEFTTDPANVTLVGQLNTTWYDYDANLSTRKFYQVAAYSGASRNFSSYAVGRHSTLVNNTPNFFSFQVMENASLQERMTSANLFAFIYYFDNSGVLSFRWFDSFAHVWINPAGNPEDLGVNFSVGYAAQGFNVPKYFTAVGEIPVGLVSQQIPSGDSFFGTESFSNVSLLSAMPSASLFSFIYYYNGQFSLSFRWFDSFAHVWINPAGNPEDLDLLPDYGYWTTRFTTASNLTYMRN